MEEVLKLLTELDRILLGQHGPFVQERHEQLQQRIADAQAEIEFLREGQAQADAKRQERFGSARCMKTGKTVRVEMRKYYIVLIFVLWLYL